MMGIWMVILISAAVSFIVSWITTAIIEERESRAREVRERQRRLDIHRGLQ